MRSSLLVSSAVAIMAGLDAASATSCSANVAAPDCSGFYYCVNGDLQTNKVSCPAGTLFDSSSQICNYADQVSCNGSGPTSGSSSGGVNGLPTCDNGFTGQVGALDCSGFYYCLYGNLDVSTFRPCTGETLYDSNAGICTWESSVVCTTDNSTIPSANATNGTNPLCANNNGVVASTDCKGFYYCFYGQVMDTYIGCPAGTLFDPSLGVCNWASQVNCNVTGVAPVTVDNSAKYWPDFFGSRDCVTGGGYEPYMAFTGYDTHYLFNTKAQCCTKWGAHLSGC